MKSKVLDDLTPEEIDEIGVIFLQRIMQNAIASTDGDGIDLLHAHQFQSLGLINQLEPPSLPKEIRQIVSDRSHPARVPSVPGPLIHIRESDTASIIDVGYLLLCPESEIRSAALDYLKQGSLSNDGWLMPATSELLASKSEELLAEDHGSWSKAAIEVVPKVRDDLEAVLARLRQSIYVGDDPGLNEAMTMLVHPKLEFLAHVRPPLYCPSEQVEEIRSRVHKLAACDSLSEALTRYFDECGCLPLANPLDAGALAEAWLDRHLDKSISWDELLSWSREKSATAKFHAVVAALRLPIAWNEVSAQDFWQMADDIIKSGATRGSGDQDDNWWPLYCTLTDHFARHIESLHPGQFGERIGCYSLWLTSRIGRVLFDADAEPRSVISSLRRQTAFTMLRWTVSRSPVEPSELRYAYAYLNSIWAMSFLGQLGNAVTIPPLPANSQVLVANIARNYFSYLLSSPLAIGIRDSAPVLAFEMELDFFRVESWLADAGEKVSLSEAIEYRQKLLTEDGLVDHLNRLLDLQPGEQYLVCTLLRTLITSSRKSDDHFDAWLRQTDKAVEVLRSIDLTALPMLLFALEEFQQRQRNDYVTRLPHLVTLAIETTDDHGRAEALWEVACRMSINGGIVSPIQRLAASKWSPEFLPFLREWRNLLLTVAKQSEPWIAARIRATSTAISRLVGPRQIDFSGTAKTTKAEELGGGKK